MVTKRVAGLVAAGAAMGMWASTYPTHAQSARGNGAPDVQVQRTGKRAMTFADLMAMKRVSDPQISPGGKWVLFSVTDVDLEKNTKTNHLWVVPIDGSAPGATRTAKVNSGGVDDSGERQVTFGAGESFGRFAPNGQFVSYTGEATKDDPYARITIATWDEKTGTIGVERTLEAVSGDADGAVWSPDSRHFLFTTEVWPECSVRGDTTPTSQNRDVGHPNPTHDDQAVGNGAPGIQNSVRAVRPAGAGSRASGSFDSASREAGRLAQDDSGIGGVEIGGTRNVAAWKTMQPAGWAEEDACDRAKDEAADRNPVKAQVWDGLLYRHWDQFTGAKRTHILVADVSMDAAEGKAGPSTASGAGAPDAAQDDKTKAAIRDVTTARDVGDAETPTYFTSGPQEYAWAPDSKEIAYVTDLSAVPAASTNNDVFTLRMDEADALPVKVSTSLGSDDEPEYSPDGRWLAFRSQRQAGFESDRERLMVSERVGGSASQQVSGPEWSEPKELMPKFDGWVDEFVWVPDNAAIVFASGNEGEESLYSCNVMFEKHQLSDNPTLVGVGGSGEYADIRVMQVKDDDWVIASRMTVSAPSEVVTFNAGMLGHTFYDISVTPLLGSSYRDPKETGELVESEETLGDSGRALTHLNDSVLADLSLSHLAHFWFTGAEGTKVEGFLLRPPGFDAKKKYPLKFIMHGGPQTMAGDSWSYRWNWELMAASGYVVIGINRRGSTGYGQKFVDEVSGDWGGRAYEDLMKGLDYAEAKYPFIDKTRECALGASYGGYMADWVLTHTSRFKCIVTHDGLYDAGAAWGSTEEMWFNEWEFRRPGDFPKGWDGFGGGYDPMGKPGAVVRTVPSAMAGNSGGARVNGALGARLPGGTVPSAGPPSRASGSFDSSRAAGLAQDDGIGGSGHPAEPWRYAGLPANEDPFRRWSPKEFIRNAKTPTLVIHSQRDYRLDVSQGFELYTALQRLGVPSRFLYFPDEGHWVLKPRDSELWNAVVSDWCDRWTKTGKYAEGEKR